MIIPRQPPFSSLLPLKGEGAQFTPEKGVVSPGESKFPRQAEVKQFFDGKSELPFEKAETQVFAVHSPENVKNLSTINQHLKGKEHLETGVHYCEDTVTLPDGTEVTGIFPEFQSECEVQLDKNDDGDYRNSRAEHEKQANSKLKEMIENDPELRKKFTEEQLEQINNGETPDGFTWHHHQDPGKMQLVDSNIHRDSRHTGGYSIWGKQEEVENA